MTTQEEQENQEPTYLGHRERLRTRFMVDEGASMPDYEMLELLLTMAIPRRDVKPLAKRLINKFDNLKGVLHAPAHRLLDIKGVTPNTIVLLRLIHACMLRSAYAGLTISENPVITSWEQMEEYYWQKLAYCEIEEFHVCYLDASYHYIGEKLLSTGTINQASVHPREIIRAALENKAVYIAIIHNHPSGAYKPSDYDIAVTREIEQLAEVMNFELYDHLIVAKDGVYSFRAHGLIKPKKRRGEDGRIIEDSEDKKKKSPRKK
jgi:DNA repair protein RadC